MDGVVMGGPRLRKSFDELFETKRVRVKLDVTFEFESIEAAKQAMGLHWPNLLLLGLCNAKVEGLGKEVEKLGGGNYTVSHPRKKAGPAKKRIPQHFGRGGLIPWSDSRHPARTKGKGKVRNAK